MLQAPAAVRDTLAAVMRQPAFDRALRETVWHRLTSWLSDIWRRLTQFTAASPALALALKVVAALLVVAIIARLGYLLRARRTAGGARRRGGSAAAGGLAGGDPWERAQAAAAAGQYTEAAHLLYAALLQALARRERLRLDPASTLGDYARDLRARSSAAFVAFRDFAHQYETVVYGDQQCDRERFERLAALAAPLVTPHG